MVITPFPQNVHKLWNDGVGFAWKALWVWSILSYLMEKVNPLMGYIPELESQGVVCCWLLAGALRDWFQMSLLQLSSYLCTGRVVRKLESMLPHHTEPCLWLYGALYFYESLCLPSVLSILVSKHLFFSLARKSYLIPGYSFLTYCLIKMSVGLALSTLVLIPALAGEELIVGLPRATQLWLPFSSGLQFSFLFWKTEICFLV